MAVSSSLIQNKTFDSITSSVYTANVVDRLQPLTFIQWIAYNNQTFTATEETLTRYQAYVNLWHIAKNATPEVNAASIRDLYVNLIEEITLNYTTVDERRYLKNLDYNDPRDMAIAVPFFAQKIKDICLYYSTLRDDVQTANVQYNLKGSNIGIENLLYNSISRALNTQDITEQFSTLSLSLSDIRNNMVIDVEDIYDTYSNYYDNSPTLPASAYDSMSDSRSEYFSANQNNIDPFLTLDFNQSIASTILKYPFYLLEIGDSVSVNVAVDPTNLTLLKDNDFITGINTGKTTDLNLNYSTLEQSKYIGVDFYYVITDSTLTSFTSGQLFAADSEFANVLNKRYPTIAAIPSQEFLKTGKEIGLFFKPDKIGLLHFTNFKFTASVNLDGLSANTVYYFPDPAKYGNVSGCTKQSFKTPLAFFEENYFNKVDFSNQYRMGDVDTHPYYQIYRAYQSREQSLDTSNFGLSRYIDAQDFFTGDIRDMWANDDVYPLDTPNLYPIDIRTQDLLTLNKTLVQYKNDIYGNEYGLYKDSYPLKTPANTPITVYPTDLIIDGWLFNDPVSGSNYSSITVNANGFVLSGTPTTIYSYEFAPETFTNDYISSTFVCSIKDALTFISPSSSLWPDYSSDNNSTVSLPGLYYNELADSGYSSNNPPTYHASFIYPADFTTIPPASAITQYDGYYFLVDYLDTNGNLITNAEPCNTVATVGYNYSYTEPSNFVSTRISGNDTIIDQTISTTQSKKSIYQSRNIDYGSLYYRNSNSTLIEPLSTALSAVFLKYSTDIINEINTQAINLDVYNDVLQIETENNLIYDQIAFDYETNTVTNAAMTYSVLTRGSQKDFEKFSTVWYNEKDKQLIACTTNLFTTYSASNYKIIFPKIYSIKLNNLTPVQIYPNVRDIDLTFDKLKIFSLSGTGFEIDIVEIEKPILNYNQDTNTYVLSYLGKDTSNAFYIINIKFSYYNERLTIISTTLYKPSFDIIHQNFGNNAYLPSFNTYSPLNQSIGSITNNVFTFNASGIAGNRILAEDMSNLISEASIYIDTE